MLNLRVDEILGADESLSTSAEILPLPSFETSLTLSFSTSKYIPGESMFVDVELEELSKPNFNDSTEGETENKLVRAS